jgi:hypothetical protein
MTTRHVASGVALCVLGGLGVAAHHAPEHIASRWFSKTPPEARNLRITVGPQGLIVASDVSQRLYPWPSLEGFVAGPDSLLVWVSDKLFLVLPRRAFGSDELQAVIQQFEQRVGPPPSLPPFWARLALTLVVAISALLLWNSLAPR